MSHIVPENSVIASIRQSQRYSALALSAKIEKETAPTISWRITMADKRATLVWAMDPLAN
jgi:hypothetical protein